MSVAIEIRPIGEGDRFAGIVAEWVFDEWGEKEGKSRRETFRRIFDHVDCPPAHVAMHSGSALGVISFCRFQAPEGGLSVWIDALYVPEDARGQGIGSQLVTAADGLVSAFDERVLVYTDLPRFYERLGYRQIRKRNEEGCAVLVHEVRGRTAGDG